MEYLATVRDGSENELGEGYWLCPVVAAEVGSAEITPLAIRLWSQEAPDFTSENDELLSLVRHVLSATEGRGIVVFDRGGDRRALYGEWAANPAIRFLIRQRGEDAALEAAKHADAMLANGDLEGQQVWKRIVKAVEELQRTEQSARETTH